MKKNVNFVLKTRIDKYDLTNVDHVKNILKNNVRYLKYKKLYLILMDKNNFMVYYDGYIDSTILRDVKLLRTGVIIWSKHSYVYKSYNNSYMFLFMVDFLFYRSKMECGFLRMLFGIPYGAYTITFRVKDD